ncbi:hypothetical protein D6851_08560 [Altericroceibacterium spongiae]|uniref:Uncharacterized protein n=1 Tax=Altericroceibacterium spongiae TaxID=2320269 RepID=A0A420EJX8_9SPHN|nr:hypothetical protein [Altericroceibacterium spongiae]RKF20995.1 hypothetical protein D6851_08560 [Altericroceibacterium spongiae]
MAEEMRKRNAAPPLPLWIAGLGLLALSACSTSGGYPSLAIREEERVSGSMEPVAPEPYIPPKTQPDLLDEIASLRNQALDAHKQFTATSERARRAANAARNAKTGGENWAVAQVALSELESSRSQTMFALADLDRIYVDAAINARELEPAASARSEVMALVEQEDTVIGEIGALIR